MMTELVDEVTISPYEQGEPLPEEPPEFAEVEDDILPDRGSYAICERCGSIVSNDPIDLKKHMAGHEVAGDQDRLVGPDLAELIRTTLKAAIVAREISQADFCRTVGVSQKHLSQMLSGAANGSMELWAKYAAALDLQWSVGLERK